MAYDAKAEMQKAEQHATHPEPGDYWHEMFYPIYLVVAADAFHVWYLHKQKSVDKDHWTWDLDQIEVKPIAEFKRSLEYGSIPGYSANVYPRSMKELVREAQQKMLPKPEIPTFDYQI